jgi:hypothetical protein
MKTPTVEDLKAAAAKKGYKWLPFQLVNIRSASDAPNQFDDLMGVVHNEQVTWHTGTTNPGVHWLKNFMNPKGTAVLAEGQHLNAWVIGKHKGQYEALVQYAPLPVYRDNNKNDKSEQIGKPIYGHYGINIHRASLNAISKIIDKWSAGCQVRNNPKEYHEFMNLCKASGVKYFSCILFNEKDFS